MPTFTPVIVIVTVIISAAHGSANCKNSNGQGPCKGTNPCYSPDGADCSFYKNCVAATVDCTGDPDEYAMSYGTFYCEKFRANYALFSPTGQAWIDAVRLCLQLSLVKILCLNKITCLDIKQTAFDSHVHCYMNPCPGSGLSICKLDLSDYCPLFQTVGSAYKTDFWNTADSSLGTIRRCVCQQVASFLSDAGSAVSAAGSAVLSATMNAMNTVSSAIGKRSVDSPPSQDQVIGDVMLYIAAKFGWSSGSTVSWFTMTTSNDNSTSSDIWTFQLILLDLVDLGVINATDAVGLMRLNATIAQLVYAIAQGLSINVDGFQLVWTSLSQCTGNDGGCNNAISLVTSPPSFGGTSTTPDQKNSSGNFSIVTWLICFPLVLLGLVVLYFIIICRLKRRM